MTLRLHYCAPFSALKMSSASLTDSSHLPPPLKPVLVVSDTKKPHDMYVVHREWVDQQEHIIHFPRCSNEVYDYLIESGITLQSEDDSQVLGVKWTTYKLERIYADCGRYSPLHSMSVTFIVCVFTINAGDFVHDRHSRRMYPTQAVGVGASIADRNSSTKVRGLIFLSSRRLCGFGEYMLCVPYSIIPNQLANVSFLHR